MAEICHHTKQRRKKNCPLTKLLDTAECMHREQRPGWFLQVCRMIWINVFCACSMTLSLWAFSTVETPERTKTPTLRRRYIYVMCPLGMILRQVVTHRSCSYRLLSTVQLYFSIITALFNNSRRRDILCKLTNLFFSLAYYTVFMLSVRYILVFASYLAKLWLLCFRHLSESFFCLALYTEEVNLQIFVMI